mmetsp:Transcript_34887/g.96351  ORF Transcript_34887/g.96351 Transcript_34887/m.96351 type:complete len:209 (+) Transcript_34887:3098-3724(+)
MLYILHLSLEQDTAFELGGLDHCGFSRLGKLRIQKQRIFKMFHKRTRKHILLPGRAMHLPSWGSNTGSERQLRTGLPLVYASFVGSQSLGWNLRRLQAQYNRKVGSLKCALGNRFCYVVKRLFGAKCVAMRHDRLLPSIPAVNFELATLLQQLPAVGVSRAATCELVTDDVAIMRTRRPIVRKGLLPRVVGGGEIFEQRHSVVSRGNE